jgi:outer membrane protein TolC
LAIACRSSGLVVLCLAVGVAAAQGGHGRVPLPEPLTLDAALSVADTAHPELEQFGAELAGAMAERARVRADDYPSVNLETALRAIEPSHRANNVDPEHNDSWIKLRLSQRLYDFGRSAAEKDAAEAEVLSREWYYLDARQQRRLEIMRRYFDVIVADLEYIRDNEAMGAAYVQFDKARDKQELGIVSDVELFNAESLYERSRQKRLASELRQRSTRALLAISLGRPGELSSTLIRPDFTDIGSRSAELDSLLERALEHNPVLRALRARVKAGRERLRAAQADDNPVVRGELEAARYKRRLGATNPYTAAVVIEMPLYTGGRVDAEIARERARVWEYEAELARHELEIRQAVLDLWLRLEELRSRARELRVLGDFRELNLDRRRALYEMEVEPHLGSAMVLTSDFRLQESRNEFDLVMAWARLDAITGRLLEDEPAAQPLPSAVGE